MPWLTTDDFQYSLPPELIAQYPSSVRSASRLMVVDRALGHIRHQSFVDFVDLVGPNDLMVLNDTKVIPARLFGHKVSGGKIECLVERVLSEKIVLAHLRSSKSPKPDSELIFADHIHARVLAQHNGLFELEFLNELSALELLQHYGQVPLPPYLNRAPEHLDKTRYQTIFAKREGSVAAPTASLHFDEMIFHRLKKKGVPMVNVTLHIGAGTFQPVRVEALSQHIMHKEYVDVSPAVCDAVRACKARGGKVFAVGTTVTRCLETAAASGDIQPYQGETQLFIYPGYSFRCIDALLTNFHLPKSTLLMLVCAWGGYDLVMRAYHSAVENQYRFFSYGDAMVVV